VGGCPPPRAGDGRRRRAAANVRLGGLRRRHATDATWRAFERADSAGKLDLWRKNSDRDPALRERMAAALVALGEASCPPIRRSPRAWWALDRGGAAASAAWSPELLLRSVDPRQLLPAVGERALRERGYAIVKSTRSDWAEVYAELLSREEDARSLALLAEALRESAPALLERFYDQTLAQPRKALAAFVWMAGAPTMPPWRTQSLRLLQAWPRWLPTSSCPTARLAPCSNPAAHCPSSCRAWTNQAPQAYEALDARRV
jgi:hypothetical protein